MKEKEKLELRGLLGCVGITVEANHILGRAERAVHHSTKMTDVIWGELDGLGTDLPFAFQLPRPRHLTHPGLWFSFTCAQPKRVGRPFGFRPSRRLPPEQVTRQSSPPMVRDVGPSPTCSLRPVPTPSRSTRAPPRDSRTNRSLLTARPV